MLRCLVFTIPGDRRNRRTGCTQKFASETSIITRECFIHRPALYNQSFRYKHLDNRANSITLFSLSPRNPRLRSTRSRNSMPDNSKEDRNVRSTIPLSDRHDSIVINRWARYIRLQRKFPHFPSFPRTPLSRFFFSFLSPFFIISPHPPFFLGNILLACRCCHRGSLSYK